MDLGEKIDDLLLCDEIELVWDSVYKTTSKYTTPRSFYPINDLIYDPVVRVVNQFVIRKT